MQPLPSFSELPAVIQMPLLLATNRYNSSHATEGRERKGRKNIVNHSFFARGKEPVRRDAAGGGTYVAR